MGLTWSLNACSCPCIVKHVTTLGRKAKALFSLHDYSFYSCNTFPSFYASGEPFKNALSANFYSSFLMPSQ